VIEHQPDVRAAGLEFRLPLLQVLPKVRDGPREVVPKLLADVDAFRFKHLL